MCFALFYGNFCMDLYSVDSDEAMKRLTLHRYNFFFSVKHFIAVTVYGKTSFNPSSLLLFKRNSSLNASSPILFKETLPTSGSDKNKTPVIQHELLSVFGSNLFFGTAFHFSVLYESES
jgi:hypothetical protein